MSGSSPFPHVALSELYLVPSRNGVLVPKGLRDKGTAMINMGELFRYGRVGDSDMARVPLTAVDRERSLVHEGDLLFARRSLQLSGAGKCSIVVRGTEDRTFESSIIRVRVDPKRASPELLYYFFNSTAGRAEMNTIVEQAVVAGIRASDLQRLKVPAPPMPEQRGIAATLGALDDKIESNQRRRELLRNVGFSLLAKSTLASPWGTQLSTVSLSIARGVAPKYVDEPSAGLVLNQKCIRGGRVDPARARRMTITGVPDHKRARTGDILVNSTGAGTLGRVGRWHEGDVFVDSHISVIRPDPGKYPAACLAYVLLQMQTDIEQLATGSTGQTELSRERLGSLRLVLPAPTEALAIEQQLQEFEAGIAHAADEIVSLTTLRDALLPELLSGRLRVPEAREAVAEVVDVHD